MIPFILAAVGGYLIGDSFGDEINSKIPKFAEGGCTMADGGGIMDSDRMKNHVCRGCSIEQVIKYLEYRNLTVKKKDGIYVVSKNYRLGDDAELRQFAIDLHNDKNFQPFLVTKMADGGMMAKGGKVNKNSLKQRATDLLAASITKRWRNTDMGSGWYFTLESPFKVSAFGSDVLDTKLSLDLYDGEDNKEEYQEWKDELLEIGFEEFFEEMKEEHLDTFIEYLQQRDEMNM